MLKWIIDPLTSTIGRKLIMSLTGLFLILFLVVHLAGNLQLLYDDGGKSFNVYAYFMTHNGLIKFISYGLYFFILLHAFVGIALWAKNRRARGVRYAVSTYPKASWAGKQMALLGILILAFLFLHMGDFWVKMKFTDSLEKVTYAGYSYEVKDIYARVAIAFSEPWVVIAYLVGLIALAFHLWHGFDSAFQTLGLKHTKFGPLFKVVGQIYSVVIPIGFAVLPLYFLIMRS